MRVNDLGFHPRPSPRHWIDQHRAVPYSTRIHPSCQAGIPHIIKPKAAAVLGRPIESERKSRSFAAILSGFTGPYLYRVGCVCYRVEGRPYKIRTRWAGRSGKKMGEAGFEPAPGITGGDFKSPASAIPPLAPVFSKILSDLHPIHQPGNMRYFDPASSTLIQGLSSPAL